MQQGKEIGGHNCNYFFVLEKKMVEFYILKNELAATFWQCKFYHLVVVNKNL